MISRISTISALLLGTAGAWCQGDSLDHHWNDLRESLEYEKKEWTEASGEPIELNIEPGEFSLQPGNGQPTDGYGRKAPVRDFYTDYEVDENLDTENMREMTDDEIYDRGQYGDGSGSGGDYEEYIRQRRREQLEEKRRRQQELEEEIERNMTEEQKRRQEEKEKIQEEVEEPKKSNKGLQNLLVFIGILALAVLIGFIIYRIYLNRQGGAHQKVKVASTKEEFDPGKVSKTELELALEKALAKQDYREAVRVYFLFIIKDLSEKRWILWEKEKTNLSYLREMSERSEYAGFRDSVTLYEIIWYGKRDISNNEYKAVEPTFRKLLTKLGVK